MWKVLDVFYITLILFYIHIMTHFKVNIVFSTGLLFSHLLLSIFRFYYIFSLPLSIMVCHPCPSYLILPANILRIFFILISVLYCFSCKVVQNLFYYTLVLCLLQTKLYIILQGFIWIVCVCILTERGVCWRGYNGDIYPMWCLFCSVNSFMHDCRCKLTYGCISIF